VPLCQPQIPHVLTRARTRAIWRSVKETDNCVLVFVCYREALKPLCSRRGVDLTALDVYVENSKATLPLMTDTSWLGGKQLRIRGEETCPVSL
jgi:hypothetical protein